LGVAKTLVGVLTNRPKGIPVLLVESPSDVEVVGVADHRLGAQRPVLLEVYLHRSVSLSPMSMAGSRVCVGDTFSGACR
jgi:hypothetical protein